MKNSISQSEQHPKISFNGKSVLKQFLVLSATVFLSFQLWAQAETEPNGAPAQSGTQTISNATTITGGVLPLPDGSDVWKLNDGISGTFIPSWTSPGITVRLVGFSNASRTSLASSSLVSSGSSTVLNAAIYYSITVSFSSFGTTTLPYSVSLSGTALPAAGPVCAMTASITSQTDVSCNGSSDGSLTVTASGGTANYDYSWSNFSSTTNTSSNTNTISSIAAATYTVTITDNNSCTATASETITEPMVLTGGSISH